MTQDERKVLEFQPKRGPNREENCSLLLEKLREISDHDMVQRTQLGNITKVRSYLLELEKRGYVNLVNDVARGDPLLYIMLLKKDFEAKDRARKIRAKKQKRLALAIEPPHHDKRETSLVVCSHETALPQPIVEVTREINDAPRLIKDETPYTIAFIDFPNISSRGGNNKQSEEHYDIGLYRFNPMGFMGCLSYATSDMVLVNEAYAYFKRPWNNEAAVTRRMEAAHIIPVFSSVGREDIDKIMLTHMMSKCYEMLEEKAALLIIVVSGDHAFAHPLQAIKEAGRRKGTSIFAKIVSWKENLASLLEQQADEIMYIDDLHEFIDPLGYKLGYKRGKET